MPKRSQNPGNNNPRQIDVKAAEQLNRAVEAMFARVDGNAPRLAASVEPLARIAASLRDLPRDTFKARLKAELLKPAELKRNEVKRNELSRNESKRKFGREKSMSTVAEPIAAAAAISAAN